MNGPLRVPGVGVQHGVWTHLHSFFIIREAAKIVKATDGGQHEMRKLAFRPPPGGPKSLTF